MKSYTFAALAGVLALGVSTAVEAAPTWYLDEGDFLAAGTILHTTQFDGYDPNLTVLGTSESFGPLTLMGDPLQVVGVDNTLNPVRNVIMNADPGEYTEGLIGLTGYNMFAFKLGNLSGYGDQVFLSLFTNVDTYYYGMYPQPAPEALSFYGWVVPDGEYFLGFQLNNTDYGSNYEQNAIDQSFGLTDIRLGKTGTICNTRICEDIPSPAPEPGAWALMILGFGAAGAALRHRRRTLSVLA